MSSVSYESNRRCYIATPLQHNINSLYSNDMFSPKADSENTTFITDPLLSLAPITTSISCYYCLGCDANTALSSDGVTTYNLCITYYSNGVWYRSGVPIYQSCSAYIATTTNLGVTNVNCCTTNLCNGVKTRAGSLVLTLGIAIFSIIGFL
ncbi:unnamed protein product [Rotaria socialis]